MTSKVEGHFLRSRNASSRLLPPDCHAPESARKSAEGREHLRVRWEPAGRLLGVGEPAIHGNLEHTTAGPVQLHLRAGCRLLNQTCRRTGARFIASHSAIFDLNLHNLLSRLSPRLSKQQQPPRPSRRDPPPSPNQTAYITMHTVSTRVYRDRHHSETQITPHWRAGFAPLTRTASGVAIRNLHKSQCGEVGLLSLAFKRPNGFDRRPGVALRADAAES